MGKRQLLLPEPPHRRHYKQQWSVGTQVRLTKLEEPALRSVPSRRLTAKGIISKVYLKFARTPELRRVVYVVTLDTEILGEMEWRVVPGYDSFRIEVIEAAEAKEETT